MKHVANPMKSLGAYRDAPGPDDDAVRIQEHGEAARFVKGHHIPPMIRHLPQPLMFAALAYAALLERAAAGASAAPDLGGGAGGPISDGVPIAALERADRLRRVRISVGQVPVYLAEDWSIPATPLVERLVSGHSAPQIAAAFGRPQRRAYRDAMREALVDALSRASGPLIGETARRNPVHRATKPVASRCR